MIGVCVCVGVGVGVGVGAAFALFAAVLTTNLLNPDVGRQG